MGTFAAQAAMTALQVVQSRQQAKAKNAAARSAAQFQTQRIQRAQEIRERQRREQLRSTLAGQRARFASRGIGRGGSAAALLKGLTLETDRTIEGERGLNALRIGSINNALAKTQRRNLLELSSTRQRAVFNLLGKGLNSFSLFDR